MPGQPFNMLSLQDLMDLLGVSRATIDRWRKDKQLPHIKIGKEIWIDKEKLQAWILLHEMPGVVRQRPGHGTANPASHAVITVGYQSGAALLWSPLIIKQLGLFEEELRRISSRVRYEVRWMNASNGMELVEELIAGRVDIASVGDYPIVAGQALSHILPRFQPLVLAFDGKTRNGGGISLVVPSGSRFRQPEQLAAAAISTVGNSSASYRLNEWMNAYGLLAEPIAFRKMGDCLDGILTGSVEASVLWEPYLSWAQALGAVMPIAESAGGDYLTGLMTDGAWAKDNEDVIIAYLRAHLRAHDLIRKQPDRAAALVQAASGFPSAVVKHVLSQIRWDASFYSKDLQTLHQLGDSQKEHFPVIKASRDSFPFIKTYLQDAVESLNLPILPDAPLPGDWSNENLY